MTDKDSSMESNLVRKFLTGARVVGYGLQEPGCRLKEAWVGESY